MPVNVVVIPPVPHRVLSDTVRFMFNTAGYSVVSLNEDVADVRRESALVAPIDGVSLAAFLRGADAPESLSAIVGSFFVTLGRFDKDMSAADALRSASGFQNDYLAALALQYAIQNAGSDSPVNDFEMLCQGTDDLSRGFVKLITAQAIRTAGLKDAGHLLRSVTLPSLPVLRSPMDAETIAAVAAENGGFVEGLVPFDFHDVFEETACAGIYELFLDAISTRMVGSPTLGEISAKPVGVDDSGHLIFHVRGRVSTFVPVPEHHGDHPDHSCCGGCDGECGEGAGCGDDGCCGHSEKKDACACGH